MEGIVKVAVIIIKDKKLLVCRKKGLSYLISPGGKLNPGESDEECAKREILEETGCLLENLRYFDTLHDYIVGTEQKLELKVYFGDLIGNPKVNPQDSVIGFEYVGRNWREEGYVLAPALERIASNLSSMGLI